MRILLIITMMLATFASAEMVKVTEQKEIKRPFLEKIVTGKQCHEDTVKVPMSCGKDENTIGLDTLVGATIGIVIGNQFKNHKDAAKVVGGLGGAYIANNSRHSGCYTYETVTKCEPTYKFGNVYKTVGWNNCAYIDGQKYCKKTKTPVDYLNVTKEVTVW